LRGASNPLVAQIRARKPIWAGSRYADGDMRYPQVTTPAMSGIIVLTLLGCHGAPAPIPVSAMKSDHAADIVGKWLPETRDVLYDFKPDGTLEVKKGVRKIIVTVNGVYDLEGDTLSLTATSVKVTSEDKSADTSAVEEESRKRNPLNVAVLSTITWMGKDRMHMHQDPVNPGDPPQDADLLKSQ